jgi:hypothetical protein
MGRQFNWGIKHEYQEEKRKQPRRSLLLNHVSGKSARIHDEIKFILVS